MDSHHRTSSDAAARGPLVACGNGHVVQFYADDAALIHPLTDFVAGGLEAGEAVVLAATPAHIHALEVAVVDRGVNLTEAIDAGRWVALDARELLERFMVGNLPDLERFTDVVGGLLGEAGAGGRNVRVFGEMVALLWKEGNVAGTMALEECWNELAARHSFTLFCGYPAEALADDSVQVLQTICDHHSGVVPGGTPLRSKAGRHVFDLESVVRDAATEFARSRPGIDIQVVAAPHLPAAKGDPSVQRTVMHALLAQTVSSDTDALLVSVGRSGRQLVVRIRGLEHPGASPTDLVDPDLFVCRALVERQGGRLWSEHPVDGGATVAYTLPLAHA